MPEPGEPLHCPHCDGPTFSADPLDAVTVTEEGVQVDPLHCLICGAGELFPSDLIPGHVVPADS